MIRTVLGDIAAESFGVTMCHEHLAMDLAAVRGDEDSVFTDERLVLEEIAPLKALGAEAIVEVSTIDMGRDVQALRRISRESGLHVVAATGFYLQAYHPPWLADVSVDDIAELFIKELTAGIDGSDICAGVIGEVATSRNAIFPTEEKVLRASAAASREVGCAVVTHCDLATMACEQADIMAEAGMEMEKLVLSHLDLVDDNDYHRKMLESGCNLAFDTVGKTTYLPDEKRADALVRLLAQGYENQVVLSQDVSRKSYMKANGGNGYTAVLGCFIPLLKARGVTDAQLDKLLVNNPARIFNIG